MNAPDLAAFCGKLKDRRASAQAAASIRNASRRDRWASVSAERLSSCCSPGGSVAAKSACAWLMRRVIHATHMRIDG